MKIGDILKGFCFGFVGGLIATAVLLHVADSTNEVVYGASLGMTRFYVTVVIFLACLTCEMAIGTSAREVGFDLVLSWISSIWFVREPSFLDYTSKMTTFENIMKPVMFAIFIATIFSSPIHKFGEKISQWSPFSGKKSE